MPQAGIQMQAKAATWERITFPALSRDGSGTMWPILGSAPDWKNRDLSDSFGGFVATNGSEIAEIWINKVAEEHFWLVTFPLEKMFHGLILLNLL